MAEGEVLVIIETQEIIDETALKSYQAQAREQILERGGQLLGRGGSLFEGSPLLTGAVVVQRWPSEAAFREWQASEPYQPLLELRRRAARLRLTLVPAT